MRKNELEVNVIQLIGIFKYLLFIENFPAYGKLLENYSDLLINIQVRRNIEDIVEYDFKPVESSFRILQEAPPRDVKLGMYILERMQEIYEIQREIIK